MTWKSFLIPQLTEGDQDLYKNFPLVISERWQQEITETVFDLVNQECDKVEQKRKSKQRSKQYDLDEKSSDCILHGYIKRLGGPFSSQWLQRYAKLFPNRLELHQENGKPEVLYFDCFNNSLFILLVQSMFRFFQMVLMDEMVDVSSDYQSVKGEPSIILKTKDGNRIVIANQV